MKIRLFLISAFILVVSALTAISFAQRKPETEKPITGDFKIIVKTTTAGHASQSTTMIKGSRERSETSMVGGGMNINTINLTQCDLRRTIQINDSTKRYLITSMEPDDAAANTARSEGAGMGESTRGGVVTMTVNTIDTGERKEMFGFTARHLKRTTIMQSSPDSCQQQQMKIETDGWYINLEYGLNCGSEKSSQWARRSATGGCQDRYEYKTTGPTRLGYPLLETMAMSGPDGRVMFTTVKEVVDVSRQTLDAALFDVPAGYSEVRSQQELSAGPSAADSMAMSQSQSGQTNHGTTDSPMSNTSANAPAKIRIGVVELNNKTKTQVSIDTLREQLIAALNSNAIDAIGLNASSPNEAAIEAKAKGCSYILYTDISTLKNASSARKLGGIFGRATGVDTGGAGKSEARFDFRLVPTGSSSPTLQSSAAGKEDSQEASLNAVVQSEASAVAAAVNKM